MEELASLDGLAGALADALLALALSAPPAQSADRSATTPVTGGKTLLKLDGGTAAVLTDAGISIRATGPAIGPAGSPVFAFPIVGGEVNKKAAQRQDRALRRPRHHRGRHDPDREALRDRPRHRIPDRQGSRGGRIPLLRLGAVGGVKTAPGLLLLRGVNVRLTSTAAGALNQTFDTDLFEGGLPIGQATVIATTKG